MLGWCTGGEGHSWSSMNFKECAGEAGTTKAFTLQYVCWLVSRFALECLEVCLLPLTLSLFPSLLRVFLPGAKRQCCSGIESLCIIHC